MVSNEDFRQDEITPEDLGCLGEQECDEGVKEVPDVAPKAQPTTKEAIFDSIPRETKVSFKKLYDGFEQKDMPFDEFCVEMMMMANPGVMQGSLAKIIDQKHVGQARQAGVDYAMRNKGMN